MRDYCKGREVVDGRTFEIEFWTDNNLGLPWCRVNEIVLELHRKHWYSGEKEMREVKYELHKFWSFDSRLSLARQYIRDYLREEKAAEEYKREIEKFCKSSQGA